MCIHKDDVQEIAELLKLCDIVILAAPTYWANVPAIVKNLFDRLLGVAMEETKTFPKARLSNNQKVSYDNWQLTTAFTHQYKIKYS